MEKSKVEMPQIQQILVLMSYMCFKVHLAMSKKIHHGNQINSLKQHTLFLKFHQLVVYQNHMMQTKDASFLFPEKICRHRWLEKRVALMRGIAIHIIVIRRLPWLMKKKRNKSQREMKFSLCIASEVEPVVTLFQTDHPFSVFL